MLKLFKDLQLSIPSSCSENICDNNYETEYRYEDKNDKFNVQNIVKKPGCETFDIDFRQWFIIG